MAKYNRFLCAQCGKRHMGKHVVCGKCRAINRRISPGHRNGGRVKQAVDREDYGFFVFDNKIKGKYD